MKVLLVFSVSFFLVSSFVLLVHVSAQATNVAVGQNASQFNTLVFGFNWTADRIVDNCTLQDDPNNQQCCGATEDASGSNLNFMRVDFDKAYSISNIVIYGRGDQEGQTKDFRVYIANGSGIEVLVYDNICCEYGDGIFTLPVNDTDVLSIVITRPNTAILTVCEVQAFETIKPVTPMTSTSTMSSMSTPTNTTLNQTSNTTDGQSTSPGQGSTTQGQMQSSTSDQSGQSTGDPNSVPGIFRNSDVIMIFLLTSMYI